MSSGPTTVLSHGDLVGYVVMTWTDGMGWQDDWDGQVHDTYAEALRSWGDPLDDRVVITECRVAPLNDEVTHRAPPNNSGLMPCCGRTPFEVPQTDRMALDETAVTCKSGTRSMAGNYGTDER